jgi:hypothetical protein
MIIEIKSLVEENERLKAMASKYTVRNVELKLKLNLLIGEEE